jgi:hypothetical protein
MFINKIFKIILLLLLVVFILEYLSNIIVEGFMSVVGPVITPKNDPKNKPVNTYYENAKISQDFDPYSVLQDYQSNSILIQEDPEYVLTTGNKILYS